MVKQLRHLMEQRKSAFMHLQKEVFGFVLGIHPVKIKNNNKNRGILGIEGEHTLHKQTLQLPLSRYVYC